jgi:hypothetical protein
METKQEHRFEQGNALIYVLIVIGLFAALTFILSRQRGSGETNTIGNEAVNIDATQIIQVSNQVKQAVDQMLFSGSKIDDLDFCQPGEACFSSAGIHSVFAPQGGGVTMPNIPTDASKQVDANPVPGFYMGAFNNVEWTETGGSDVILVAHQISQPVCEKIDEILTGKKPATIPPVGAALATVLIDASRHTAGANVDLDKTVCPLCDGHASLCVSDAGAAMFSFYNVIEQR